MTTPAPPTPTARATRCARGLRGAARLRRWITPAFAALTVLGIVLAVRGQWDVTRTFDWTIGPATITAAVLLFTVPVFAQGASWWVILVLMGAPSRPWPSVLVWMRGFVARYAPSGALTFALRVRERERMGLTTAQVMIASGYEQLAAPTAGAVACVAAFLAAGVQPHWAALALLAGLVTVAVLVRPAWGGRLIMRVAAARGWALPGLLRGRYFAVAVAVNVAAWPAAGAAAWLLLDSLTPDPPGYWTVLAAYALAWLVGVLVPFLPGGLGLREGLLAALLAPHYGLGVATTLALGLRLVNTMGEMAAVGLLELVALHPRARRASRPG